jgi:hypothetical protein
MEKTRPQLKHNNDRLLCNARTGSLLVYTAIPALLTEWDIGDRDVGEREIGETLATYRLAKRPLNHIHILCVLGYLSASQTWHYRARYLRRHKLHILQPTERMNHKRSWSLARLPGLWVWGRHQRMRPWGKVTHLQTLLR